jgi:rhamnogalacturonan endolyase
VGDLDGDGEYELVVKWNPTNAQDNSYYGITGKVYLDAYKLDGTFLWRIDLGKNIRAGAHYTQFMVYDLNGDGRAEVVCKTAPGTIDGKGNYVLLNSDDPNADYRNLTYAAISGPTMLGAIVNGPEYLTLFDGLTGEALHTISYKPERGSISSWGDSYGNRVDRHLACVAYLDGVKPSVVMCRGYYTRSTLVAYDVIDKKLVERWYHNSTVSGQGAYGEGFHNLSVADVDQDGRDEIIYGSCAIDDNGLLLYRSGTGHGDAMHVSDMDPDRPGLEIWTIHEDTKSPYGYQLRDAKTGQNLWGVFTGTDVGRGMAGDVDARYRGFEMWSYALDSTFDCKGNKISKSKPASNFRIYWDGDVQDELLDGVKITKWNGSGNTTLLTASSYLNSASTNTTKSNPCISADILGDWREEVIYYNSADPSRINLFTTVTSTTNKLYTLMHDPVYRLGIAWQNVAYNQPPHLGFYLGDGVANAPVPDIYLAKYDGGTGLEIEKSGLKVFLKQDILNVTGINSESKIYIYDIMGKLITVKQLLEAGTAEISVPSDEHLLIVKICQNNSVKSYKIVR